MRVASTISPPSMKLAWCSAPAVSTKLSGIAIHSTCQGPVARSKSCTIASSIRPACWRTRLGGGEDQLARDRVALLRHGRGRAAALRRTARTPRRTRSQTISITSNAILPSVPVTSARNCTASAKPSRATCQVIAGSPRPSSRAQRLLHGEAACRRARPACRRRRRTAPTSTRGFSSASRSACRSNIASQTAAL